MSTPKLSYLEGKNKIAADFDAPSELTDASKSPCGKRWVCECVAEDGSGDLMLQLHPEMLETMGWKEGTVLNIEVLPNGNGIKLTRQHILSEMLKDYDPELHGGEFMVTPGPIGREVLE